MITVFENCGYVYKLEARYDGVRVFVAKDADAIEKLRIGLTGEFTWELAWRA